MFKLYWPIKMTYTNLKIAKVSKQYIKISLNSKYVYMQVDL